MATSYGQQFQSTKVMLEGLKSNTECLSKWGIDQAFLTNFEKVYQDTMDINAEQQALKARLKEKTATVTQNIATLRKLRRVARYTVKEQIPQDSWKEFGIQATR